MISLDQLSDWLNSLGLSWGAHAIADGIGLDRLREADAHSLKACGITRPEHRRRILRALNRYTVLEEGVIVLLTLVKWRTGLPENEETTVSAWLNALGLSHLRPHFADDACLEDLPLLTDDDLLDMGIRNAEERNRILRSAQSTILYDWNGNVTGFQFGSHKVRRGPQIRRTRSPTDCSKLAAQFSKKLLSGPWSGRTQEALIEIVFEADGTAVTIVNEFDVSSTSYRVTATADGVQIWMANSLDSAPVALEARFLQDGRLHIKGEGREMVLKVGG